jgi:hypothetical protein
MKTASHTPNPGDFIKNEFGAQTIISYSKVEILSDYICCKKFKRKSDKRRKRITRKKRNPSNKNGIYPCACHEDVWDNVGTAP